MKENDTTLYYTQVLISSSLQELILPSILLFLVLHKYYIVYYQSGASLYHQSTTS